MRTLRALLVVAIVHATVAVAVPCAGHRHPAHAGGPCHESRAPAPPDGGGSCPALACPPATSLAVLPPLIAPPPALAPTPPVPPSPPHLPPPPLPPRLTPPP